MKLYSIITNPESQLPHSVVYRTIRIDTILRGEPLTETFYVYHPINHQHIPAVINYIYEFLNYWLRLLHGWPKHATIHCFITFFPTVYYDYLQTQDTVKHNNLMLHNNVLQVSVHQNRHWAPLLQQCQQPHWHVCCMASRRCVWRYTAFVLLSVRCVHTSVPILTCASVATVSVYIRVYSTNARIMDHYVPLCGSDVTSVNMVTTK